MGRLWEVAAWCWDLDAKELGPHVHVVGQDVSGHGL